MPVIFKVFRFDPSIDSQPRYEMYEVPAEKETTVLDGLIYIKEKSSKNLSYRRSCREGVCGSCSMRINKITRLACKTHIFDVLDDNFGQIEHLDHLQVITDLVVDLEHFLNDNKNIRICINTNLTADKIELIRKT